MRIACFQGLGLSTEAVLQLLQRFLNSPIHIKQIHAVVVTSGVLAASRWKATFVFNTLIRSYLNMGQYGTCLVLFRLMLGQQVAPNYLTFPSLIKAAYSSFSVSGFALHGQTLKRGVLWDPFIQTSFVRFYSEVGDLRSAGKKFDEILDPCIVACNTMLDAYGRNGETYFTLKLFRRMPLRDVVSWTTVINGFAKNGFVSEALRLFGEMMQDKDVLSGIVIPNEATFASVLSSCANFDQGGLYLGKQMHGYIMRKEIILSASLGTALINMYGKVGHLGTSYSIFNQMCDKEVCTWNAMISALAYSGKARQALRMFEMMKLNDLHPNEITFVAVLTACARSKLVDTGIQLFHSMHSEYRIVPAPEHYGCVVDLLGRAGLFNEAVDFICSLPFKPDASIIGPLLGACKIHEVTGLGNEVGKRLLELQPQHCGPYVTLSSMNALAKNWADAAELRKVMKQAGVQKIPAYSIVCVA